jgi:inosine/xanthosine triphosphatase
MKRVCVVSKNPVKVEAVKQSFAKMFPQESFNFFGLSANSDVKDQPNSDVETRAGALNRINNAKSLYSDYDYYVALEGGVLKLESGYYECFAWCAIYHDEIHNINRSGSFTLPKKIGELLDNGKELGEADDIVFGRTNSKQSNGAVGILTNDAITRTSFYVENVSLTLIPFKNIDLYI